MKRIELSGKIRRTAYRKNGLCELEDARKLNLARSNERDLAIQEKYERLKTQNTLLKAENKLLKKLHMVERSVKQKK